MGLMQAEKITIAGMDYRKEGLDDGVSKNTFTHFVVNIQIS
jgi:hypothetical protein